MHINKQMENSKEKDGLKIETDTPLVPNEVPDETPYQKCTRLNEGKCGVCNADGSFTACA